jgi:hypothetical protein
VGRQIAILALEILADRLEESEGRREKGDGIGGEEAIYQPFSLPRVATQGSNFSEK